MPTRPSISSAGDNESATAASYPELRWLDLASGYQRPTAHMHLLLPADEHSNDGAEGSGSRRSWSWGFLSFVCGDDEQDEPASGQRAATQHSTGNENARPGVVRNEFVPGHRRTPAISHTAAWQSSPFQPLSGPDTAPSTHVGLERGHRRMPASVRRLPPGLGPYETVHYLECQTLRALESTGPMLRMLGRRGYSDGLRREAVLRSTVRRFGLAIATAEAFEAAAEVAMDFREIEWEGGRLTIDDIFDVIDERLGGIVDTSWFSPPLEVVERDAAANEDTEDEHESAYVDVR